MTTNFLRGVGTVAAVLALTCASGGPILALRAQAGAGTPSGVQTPGEVDSKEQRKRELEENAPTGGEHYGLPDRWCERDSRDSRCRAGLAYDDQVRRHFDGTLWV